MIGRVLLFMGFNPDEFVVDDDGSGPRIAKWLSNLPQPTAAEIEAARVLSDAAILAEGAKRVESDTARDDAKRALAALDTIIGGIDGATLVQAKVAIKQLAQIQRHIILATVGR